jgi:hypothetical protein
MPAYITAPPAITPRRGLQEGIPGYSAGTGPALFGQSDSRFAITAVAANGATATLTGALVEGPVPPVGGLITVQGTSVGGGVFNVTNAAITAVSLNANGVGTIQYALAQTIPQTNDGGRAIVPPLEVGETTAAQKYQQFAVPPPAAFSTGGRQGMLSWRTSTTATIALQAEQAIEDVDAAYSIIGVSQTTLSGSLAILISGKFVRVNVTAQTGGGLIIAKFLI